MAGVDHPGGVLDRVECQKGEPPVARRLTVVVGEGELSERAVDCEVVPELGFGGEGRDPSDEDPAGRRVKAEGGP